MEHGICGKNLTWTLDDKGTLTINGSGAMNNYESDFVYFGDEGGYYGEEGDSPWWDYHRAIKRIIICDGVTSIGDNAFFNCQSLEEIKIPEGVESIGDLAFDWCINLTRIIIPEGVTSIGKGSFSGCKSLKGITIPDGVTLIGTMAFLWCTNLKKIKIPDSVTMIGERVFKYCSSLKEIRYPAGRGFEEYLSQGNNAQLIPFEKLWWKVEGKTLMVGGVSEIKAYSYEATPWRDSLNDIQRIIIEEGVEKISAGAFEECRRLELLTIPASVKTIGDMAFSFCYCGDWRANGGKNVYWTLEDGVLNLKKNPTVRGDADFSTGSITWLAIDKNITGINLDAGIVPKEKFFEWLSKRGNITQIAFG